VTAALPPEGIAAGALIRDLRERHGVVVAGGQGRLSGTIIRIGHMGWVEEEDIALTMAALEECIRHVRGAAG
jgi:aspartate aminotransferase-like enzyme